MMKIGDMLIMTHLPYLLLVLLVIANLWQVRKRLQTISCQLGARS